MTISQAFEQALQCHRAGRLAEAEAGYRRILAAEPNHADALHLLGVIAHQVGRHDAAVGWIRQAIVLNPNHPAAHSNLGEAYRSIGRLDEAVTAFRRALELKPDAPETHNNLGAALAEQGELDGAMDEFHRALQLKPDYPEAHNNLGNALKARGQPDKAVSAFQRALELKPGYLEALNNLGNTLKDLGLLDEAIAAFRQALRIKSDLAWVHSNLVYSLNFHPDCDTRAIAEECARWEQQHAAPLRASILPHDNDRDPARRLKIGYVSSNFYFQAECHFLVPLFEAHDHRLFEIYAYSDVRHPDAITEQMKQCMDVWRDVRHLTDEQLADQIRQDKIDVLVDLSMHMGRNRLLVFAREPAPAQVAWLAYPGSAGLRSIGYRLTDSHIEPPGEESESFPDEPVRLADSWCCYRPVGDSPEVSALPALSAEGVTFGSLNNFGKAHDGVLARWARVLEAVPGSRLLMRCPEGRPRERVRAFFGARGIVAERLEFVGDLPRLEYLRLYQKMDLGLDPFPYNGITTTCDALWMGVPVLTLPGVMPASRAGLSLLSSVGLGELAPRSEHDYVRLAMELAGDLPRLADLRATLRERMLASPLMDARRFARNVEAAYRAMWERWRLAGR